MKKIIKDTNANVYYTESEFSGMYQMNASEMEEFADYADFLATSISLGEIEAYTAKLSDSMHIYDHYFTEEGDVMTAMGLYMLYQSIPFAERDGLATFADFLNIPTMDRNGFQFYGLEEA